MSDDRETPTGEGRSLVERRLDDSLIDRGGVGRPLSRRARQTRRSVEAYLAAGVLPRYMERLREIETAIATERRRIERAYRRTGEAYGHDAAQLSRRWRAIARAWPFEHINELIREHNEWYPVEASLPLDPRTRDYVTLRGRSYRRSELGPDWVLERFPVPARPAAGSAQGPARQRAPRTGLTAG